MSYINQQGKVLRHANRIALLQAGKTPFPVNMEVDISNRCSLGCGGSVEDGGCHFSYTHTKGPLAVINPEVEATGDLMDLGMFSRIAREMAEAGVKSITFTGGGEPIVHPMFHHFLEIAKAKGLEVGIYTSLAGWAPHKVKAIRDCCTWAVISLDEPTREAYEAWKGTNAFQSVCRGVRELTADGSKCVVGASFLLHEGNWQKVEDMYKLHKELATDYCLFRPLVKYDLKNPSKMVEDVHDWSDRTGMYLRPLLQGMEERHADVIASLSKFERYTQWNRPYKACHAASLSGIVTPNGKVWACVNRRGFPGSCIGDLSSEPFMEVWQRQQRWQDFDQCRVLCRGDEVNLALSPLMEPMEHENFI